MNDAPHIVTMGELLLRLSPPTGQRLLQTPQLQTWFGGSEANVAVSLARFGLECEYVTCLPDNALGDAAIRALRAEGVRTGHILKGGSSKGGSRLGLYFVEPGVDLRPMRVIYDRACSAFSEAMPDAFDWSQILRGVQWLHLSGITPALSDSAATIATAAVRAAREQHVRISFDLNYREALWQGRNSQPLIRPLTEGADLLIGNEVAIERMLGFKDGQELTTALGHQWIAITKRESRSASEHGWGASLYDASCRTSFRSCEYRVRLVDRVGGGDAFTAALIFALVTGKGAQAAIDFATAAGALKLTIGGDWNLVSIAEVEQAAEKSRSEP